MPDVNGNRTNSLAGQTPADSGDALHGHILHGWSGAGPVVWDSWPLASGSRQDLLPALLKELDSLLPPGQRYGQGEPLRLEHTSLGRPLLFLGETPGPSLSFSQAGGRFYAALAASGQVGLDVAFPEEFRPPYPLARILHPKELDLAHNLCPGDSACCAALLWALKEAAVKALGEGFRRLAPRDVEVGPAIAGEGGLFFPVAAASAIVLTRAQPRGQGWLALALWNPPASVRA
jgi:hypothetical protein